MFGPTLTPIDFGVSGGSPATGTSEYRRPGGTDKYLRPDGTSLYKRPAGV